jgi:glycosyltransferase involved in cell wall biosynthesis
MSRPTLLNQIQSSTSPGPFFQPDSDRSPAPLHPKVKLIAFYLPQYHPIPENDAWWGRGFTEWTNVTKALPRFVGHVQPRLPTDLGFYDLRNPDILRQQAKIAQRYGIGGFCFHYYWFNGHRMLEKPLELLLSDPSIDIPFCINWANENWTRRWDGLDGDVLMAQSHSPQDDVDFARNLISIVSDPRYIRVDGRPLVMIYRPLLLPEPVATMRRWRVEFARAGLGNPYIVMAQAFDSFDPRLYGVDAAVEFPPHKIAVTRGIHNTLTMLDPNFAGHVVDYDEISQHAMSLSAPPFKLFRGVCPAWDNEARKPGRGFTLANSTPAAYGRWLASACQVAIEEASHADERIVFINAWNEWAEGAYLEPDRHFGHAYLAETARVLTALDRPSAKAAIAADGRIHLGLISHDAHFHGAQVVALAIARTLVVDHNIALTILIGGPGELTPQFEALAPTETVPGNFDDLGAWLDAAHRLAASGVTAVLANTLVSARAIRALQEAGLRIIQLVHELPAVIRQYHLEDASRNAAAHAAAIVFASTYVRDRFLEIAGPIRGRTVVRHQGLHMRRLAPAERPGLRNATRRQLGIGDDRRVVLGIGYGDLRKGLDLWPALIRRVVAKCPMAMFVWVGRVDPEVHRKLDRDLRKMGLQKYLLLPGTFSDLAGIYVAGDAFALTSREDPFPSVVVEAMASGVPTVVFRDSGGIVDLVRDAGGVTVPYMDIDAMGDALTRILLDPTATETMGATLAARIARDFEYADYGADLIALACAPFVSVVVPNFNYGRHLRQRIQSIWAQSIPISELIILDDASTDNSAAMIAELANESPFPIRVVRNDVNSGSVSRQWARGVAMARGEFVWIAEADDFADPEFLAAVLPAFDDPETVLSYSESRMADENGEITAPDYRGYVSDIDPVRWTRDFQATGPNEVATALSVKNTVPNVSAVVFRRKALAAVLHDHLAAMADHRYAADWLCYIRLLQHGGKVAFTTRALNTHRRHASSVTVSPDNRRHFKEIVAMQDLAATVVPVTPATRAIAIRYRDNVAKQFGLVSDVRE